jgi:hypothetical protein
VKTNLLEEPQAAPSQGKRYSCNLHKHGILTLLIG